MLTLDLVVLVLPPPQAGLRQLRTRPPELHSGPCPHTRVLSGPPARSRQRARRSLQEHGLLGRRHRDRRQQRRRPKQQKLPPGSGRRLSSAVNLSFLLPCLFAGVADESLSQMQPGPAVPWMPTLYAVSVLFPSPCFGLCVRRRRACGCRSEEPMEQRTTGCG